MIRDNAFDAVEPEENTMDFAHMAFSLVRICRFPLTATILTAPTPARMRWGMLF